MRQSNISKTLKISIICIGLFVSLISSITVTADDPTNFHRINGWITINGADAPEGTPVKLVVTSNYTEIANTTTQTDTNINYFLAFHGYSNTTATLLVKVDGNWLTGDGSEFFIDETKERVDVFIDTSVPDINNSPIITNPNPIDAATNVDNDLDQLSVVISDFEGDDLNWVIETSPDVGSGSGNNEANGTKTCSISNLNYNMVYTWYVNVTDGSTWTNKTFSFTVENDPTNDLPIADFSISPTDPTTDDTISFNDASTDTDGSITSWSWDFGDGDTSTQQNPTYQYSTSGDYSVTLTVTDDDGATNSITKVITVNQGGSGDDDDDVTPPGDDDDDSSSGGGSGSSGGGGGGIPAPSNQAPTAAATVDLNTGTPGLTCTFDASASEDTDGTIVEYYWDFDDGTTETTDQETITHTFTNSGSYAVMLTVTDDDAETDELDEPILIEIEQGNNPPTDLQVSVTPDTKTTKNTDLTFSMSATDADESDTIHFEINWGDGKTTISEEFNSTELYSVGHSWATYGVFNVDVAAYDTQNASDDWSTKIVVDVLVIDDEINGWLIDTDSDGSYEEFKNTETDQITDVQEENESVYLLNTDEDSDWEYSYNVNTETLNEYQNQESDQTQDDDGSAIAVYVLIGLILLLFVVFGYLVYKNNQDKQKKKDTKKKESKQQQEQKKNDEQKQDKKKQAKQNPDSNKKTKTSKKQSNKKEK
jgi:PKD repeat protein